MPGMPIKMTPTPLRSKMFRIISSAVIDRRSSTARGDGRTYCDAGRPFGRVRHDLRSVGFPRNGRAVLVLYELIGADRASKR